MAKWLWTFPSEFMLADFPISLEIAQKTLFIVSSQLSQAIKALLHRSWVLSWWLSPWHGQECPPPSGYFPILSSFSSLLGLLLQSGKWKWGSSTLLPLGIFCSCRLPFIELASGPTLGIKMRRSQWVGWHQSPLPLSFPFLPQLGQRRHFSWSWEGWPSSEFQMAPQCRKLCATGVTLEPSNELRVEMIVSETVHELRFFLGYKHLLWLH